MASSPLRRADGGRRPLRGSIGCAAALSAAALAAGASLAASSHAAAPARSAGPSRQGAIGYRKVKVGRIPAHVVQVDLRRREVRVSVAVAKGGIGGREPWSRFIARTRPTAAITGTYFDTATCIPVGSLVINGIPVHWGQTRTALGITRANEAGFLSCRRGKSAHWKRYDALIHAGPRLLTAGRVTLFPRAEGFRDRAIFARKPRSAVGLTRSGKLLLVAVTRPIYLRELARLMRALGARDAMALDGGGSTGLYCRGKSYVAPKRSLTNLLVIYETEAHYLRSARQLAPAVRDALIRQGR